MCLWRTKKLLEQHYANQKEDVFVATFNALQKDDGSVFSYVTWNKDVDTLLPKTDKIIFIDLEDETQRYQLAWDAVLENFGALMEPTVDTPPRWRVRTYPDDKALKTLAELSIEK